MNSLLAVMEANLSYVPSSTAKAELADISLFDHVKFTAAVASCIYDYLNAGKKIVRMNFSRKRKNFMTDRLFLLCSLDISCIQNFYLYNYFPKCIRTLRARSFI